MSEPVLITVTIMDAGDVVKVHSAGVPVSFVVVDHDMAPGAIMSEPALAEIDGPRVLAAHRLGAPA